MKTIMSIVGARPQFIKYHAVSKVMSRYDEYKDVLVHTGQHYDYNMSGVFFDGLNIKQPDYNLNINNTNNAKQIIDTSKMLDAIMFSVKPDVVIVYGDTNATLAGALAAKANNVTLVHVEAGLRSYNLRMTEEMNRIATDSMADILFCPCENAVKNLGCDGITEWVYNVGDVTYDIVRSINTEPLKHAPREYSLLTMHRAETVDNKDNLSSVVSFVNKIAKDNVIIFPIHPRTKKKLGECATKLSHNVVMWEPVGYVDMLSLIQYATMAITDSGGVQREAYWFGVPCVTLRNETEWVETIQSGWNVLYKNYTGYYKPEDSTNDAYGIGLSAASIMSDIGIYLKRNG